MRSHGCPRPLPHPTNKSKKKGLFATVTRPVLTYLPPFAPGLSIKRPSPLQIVDLAEKQITFRHGEID